MNKSREKVEEGVTDDDVNEVKQDISSFRYELLEVLRNNGMTIPNYSKTKNTAGSKQSKKMKLSRPLSFGYCVNQGPTNRRLSWIGAQGESICSSIDELFEAEARRLSEHSSQTHHKKLSRTKLGQVVVKALHKYRSNSRDLCEESAEIELSERRESEIISLSPQSPCQVEGPLDVSQCPSEEPLLPHETSAHNHEQNNGSSQKRRKLFASAKSETKFY